MQIESEGLITVSPICFESDLILWSRTVMALSVIVFLFIVENKSFCFRRSYSSNASLFTLIAFFKFPNTVNIMIGFYPAERSIGLNDFCFCRSKSITHCSKLKS